jgi:hypothetical protein
MEVLTMPTRESILRTMNTQLEQYKRRLGEESEEYEALTTNLYALLGKPQENKRGYLTYSRAKSAEYTPEDLQAAYDLVTGENTASRIEQKYIAEIVEFQGIEDVTAPNVKRFIRVRNKVYQYYSELYEYLRASVEEKYGIGSWDDSTLRWEFYQRGAMSELPLDTPFWLEENLNDLEYNGLNFRLFDATEKALQHIMAADNAKKEKLREKAAKTKKSGKIKL